MTQLDPIATALVYADALSWTVASRSDPHVTYLVELGDYAGNGACSCDDFKIRFGSLLSRAVTSERAVRDGLVKWPNAKRPYQLKVSDALRCAHICEARDQACTQFVRAISEAQKHCHATPNTP